MEHIWDIRIQEENLCETRAEKKDSHMKYMKKELKKIINLKEIKSIKIMK